MSNEKNFLNTARGLSQGHLSDQVQQQSHVDPKLRNPEAPHTMDDKLHLDKVPDLLKPAAPETNDTGEFKSTGPVWWIGLTNDQTHALSATVASGEGLAPLTGPLWVVIAAQLAAAVGYIEMINSWGGNNGVDINGVVGTMGLIVTPRVGKVYKDLINAARLAVSGRTILDFVLMASSKVPQLAGALNVGVAASIFNAVASGTPLGWAIAGGLGYVVNLLEPEPDPNAHGAVLADRTQIGDWESFTMATVGAGNKVSLLAWQGLFSAQSGGGHGVYANRMQVGDWETWTLIGNPDGTASLQTINGHYLTAEGGGGSVCQADRTAIGNWEKFFLVNLPSGKVALKTHDQGKFVSVQG